MLCPITGHHNRGICFTNPETNQHWLALSCGWYVESDWEKIEKYVSEVYGRYAWVAPSPDALDATGRIVYEAI